MSAPNVLKACPRCGLQAHLNAYSCVQCGHVYSTQFNPGQTQAFVPQPCQAYQAPVARDEFEWKVQVAWLWAFAAISVFIAYLCARAWLVPATDLPGMLALLASPFVGIGALGLFSFCVVRLRRLYVYGAPYKTGWRLTAWLLAFGVASAALVVELPRWAMATEHRHTKIEMADGIRYGMRADELLRKFGEPSTRDREGVMGRETWTYEASDGVVFVTLSYGTTVTDVSTL